MRAPRDEPDLRETLYERPINSAANVTYTYADESQSGFRMFNELNDDTLDASGNWSVTSAVGGRPTRVSSASATWNARATSSRAVSFIPITTQKADTGNLLFDNLLLPQGDFHADQHRHGLPAERGDQADRCVRGDQTTAAGYGMVDFSISNRSRLIAGARVERFDQTVTTPVQAVCARGAGVEQNTDFFPAVNFVQATDNSNVRLSYSTTVNRPNSASWPSSSSPTSSATAPSRKTRGLRAHIQNVDGRWGGSRAVGASSRPAFSS